MTDETPFGPTGRLVYERTYSRPKPDGTREVWPETVDRVIEGNLGLVYGPQEQWSEEVFEEYVNLAKHMKRFGIIPAGRHLWASGVKGRQYLFNPVVGSSEVMTRDGSEKIVNLVDQTVDVLSMSNACDYSSRTWESIGKWRPATFVYSGEQETYRVVFESGREVVSTAEHVWYTKRSRTKLTTLELVGEQIPVMVPPRPEENGDYWVGVMRGIIFGDGSTTCDTPTGEPGKAYIRIHADEKMELLSIFEHFGHRVSVHSDGVGYVGRLPREWKKSLPSLDESPSYWRGFFVGWMAADGCVNKDGTAALYNRDLSVFEYTKPGLLKAGVLTGDPVLQRDFNPFNGEPSTMYRLQVAKFTLDPRDLLQGFRKDRYRAAQIRTATDRVVAVEKTGLTEPVYCCLEPTTKSWTVNGVLTGNCHVSGWGETPWDHFQFTFLRLMEGGGVGANYSNRFLEQYEPVQGPHDVHIVCSSDHPDYAKLKDAGVLSDEYVDGWDGCFEVMDSREGWADALVDLMGAYYRSAKHTNRVFDISRVRGAGARLKTFGGRASGPLPLAVMLHEVAGVLNANEGFKLDGISAMSIDHAIAKCVVSGGNRRSARMAIMHWADPQIEEFLRIKRDGGHWTTNVSVEVDDDFFSGVDEDDVPAIQVLDQIAEGMLYNGEPGIWNSSLSNEGEPNEVVATNPCLTGDTVIATVSGPRTLADLAESGEDVEVYSWDPKTKTPVVRWMRRPHKTREDAEILKVTFDSGLVVRCTPEHSFYTFRGKKVQAKDLMGLRSKSIRAFSASYDSSGHERVHGWDSKRNAANHQWTHRMIWENANGPIPEGMVVAHLDGDAGNNALENLEVMTPYEHASYDYPKRALAGFDGHSPNHKVVSVEPGGFADVYNGMVEDSHTYIVLDPEPIAGHMSGIVSANCGEIALEPWENCNLGHVNLAAYVGEHAKIDVKGLIEAHQLVTRFLIRATYGDVNDSKQASVLARNRRIGVGHLGFASFVALAGVRYSEAPKNEVLKVLLNSMAQVVDVEAFDYTHELRIPFPVKTRTVAPTGTIAKLPGVSEGIHPIFAKYFIRRVRFSTIDPDQVRELEKLALEGYHCEPDLMAPETEVVSLPTKDILLEQVAKHWGEEKAEEIVQSAADVSLHEMLAVQEMYQSIWADNAVSYTVNIDPEKYDASDIALAIRMWGESLKGTTVFPEQSFDQPPYERITKEEYEAAEAKRVEDSTDPDCASGACPIR